MTMVSILPLDAFGDDPSYLAVAGGRRSTGRTVGEALDGLAAQLTDDEAATLLVVRGARPDGFFGALEIRRLDDLMRRWREARDLGGAWSREDQAELDELVEAEVRASGARAGALADALVATVQDWEHDRCRLEGPAYALGFMMDCGVVIPRNRRKSMS